MTNKLRIIADENIPALTELAADVADIVFLPGRTISAKDLLGADALLVRSITPVNAALLHASGVRFVGTCTIGTDHVDMQYLSANDIAFASAPGCNAAAVVDYVIAGMLAIYNDISVLKNKVVGIVGYGEVGGRLQKRLQSMGIAHKVCDPFRDEAKASFDEILACDIISLHVPYTKASEHATHHLLDASGLQRIKSGGLLINTSRGAVVDNVALASMLSERRFFTILDVYEDEPSPSMELLDGVDIATAHIAGYSLHGKIRGTMQVVQSMFNTFGIERSLPDLLGNLVKTLELKGNESLSDVVRQAYDINADSCTFIEHMRKAETVTGKSAAFDLYRKNYPVRYEWSFIQAGSARSVEDYIYTLGFGKK